jgi:hypothetical protein
MRILKGMMACMAALFMLGYVNSCDSGAEDNLSQLEQSTEIQTIRK